METFQQQQQQIQKTNNMSTNNDQNDNMSSTSIFMYVFSITLLPFLNELPVRGVDIFRKSFGCFLHFFTWVVFLHMGWFSEYSLNGFLRIVPAIMWQWSAYRSMQKSLKDYSRYYEDIFNFHNHPYKNFVTFFERNNVEHLGWFLTIVFPHIVLYMSQYEFLFYLIYVYIREFWNWIPDQKVADPEDPEPLGDGFDELIDRYVENEEKKEENESTTGWRDGTTLEFHKGVSDMPKILKDLENVWETIKHQKKYDLIHICSDGLVVKVTIWLPFSKPFVSCSDTTYVTDLFQKIGFKSHARNSRDFGLNYNIDDIDFVGDEVLSKFMEEEKEKLSTTNNITNNITIKETVDESHNSNRISPHFTYKYGKRIKFAKETTDVLKTIQTVEKLWNRLKIDYYDLIEIDGRDNQVILTVLLPDPSLSCSPKDFNDSWSDYIIEALEEIGFNVVFKYCSNSADVIMDYNGRIVSESTFLDKRVLVGDEVLSKFMKKITVDVNDGDKTEEYKEEKEIQETAQECIEKLENIQKTFENVLTSVKDLPDTKNLEQVMSDVLQTMETEEKEESEDKAKEDQLLQENRDFDEKFRTQLDVNFRSLNYNPHLQKFWHFLENCKTYSKCSEEDCRIAIAQSSFFALYKEDLLKSLILDIVGHYSDYEFAKESTDDEKREKHAEANHSFLKMFLNGEFTNKELQQVYVHDIERATLELFRETSGHLERFKLYDTDISSRTPEDGETFEECLERVKLAYFLELDQKVKDGVNDPIDLEELNSTLKINSVTIDTTKRSQKDSVMSLPELDD